jgi:hypothetical protein
MSTSIVSPFPNFNDLDGTPLENGFIYIGTANLNPETSPIQVYWDAEFTIPAAQPIRTIGGYPSRSGSPGNLHVQAETFSITVRDIRRTLVFSAFNQTTATDSKIYNIGVQAITASGGQTVFTLTTFTYLPTSNTLQVYKNGLRLTLGADYTETNSSTVTLTSPALNGDKFLFQGGAVVTNNEIPATDVSFQPSGTGAVTRSIQEKAREYVSFKDFGAVGNGTTDDSAAVTAALATGSMIDGLGLTYKVTAQPSSYANIKNAAFKAEYITYTTEDFLNQNTAKVTNAKAYTAWPQDKCYVVNNQIRLWANYGDSHIDPDRRAVVFNSDDSGISFQEGEFLDETANGLTSWSAGTDGTYEYVFASTAATTQPPPASPKLSAAVDAVVTTLPLDTAYSFQSSGIVTIDSEQILYTGKTLTTLTGCTRGYNGTTAASHLINAPVSAGILLYMFKRTVPAGGGNSYAGFTKTLLDLPWPTGFTSSPIYQHSFASNGTGLIVTGAHNGEGAWLLKSGNNGATWTAHVLQKSTNAEEPTVKWDATTGKWYGFIRAGDSGGLLQFFVASADLATVTLVPVPVGYFNANALIDSPVPFVIVNGVIHAFCSYRSGTDEGNPSDKNASAFYIQAVIADVVANGNNIWTTSTTKTYYIGNLLHLESGGASGCGVGSVVSYENKVFLFYGSEERFGTFPATLATTVPFDRIVNIYQTVFPISEKAGFIDYRSKLPEDRSANNPAMRLPGGLTWKAKEGTWVWSKSGQLSASYVNAKSNTFGDYIFDLASSTGGVAVSTDNTSSVGYSVFNTFGTGPTGWFTDGVGNLRFQINGTARFRWNESALSFRPEEDNTTTLGGATFRWSTVYAATGTINTSDLRDKQDVAPLDEAEKRVAVAIKGLIRKFRFKDAVAKKGDAARIHVGVIAQEVKQAFEAEGLDATKYGILCCDKWEAFDDQPAGDRYGVRYDELLAFVISAI